MTADRCVCGEDPCRRLGTDPTHVRRHEPTTKYEQIHVGQTVRAGDYRVGEWWVGKIHEIDAGGGVTMLWANGRTSRVTVSGLQSALGSGEQWEVVSSHPHRTDPEPAPAAAEEVPVPDRYPFPAPDNAVPRSAEEDRAHRLALGRRFADIAIHYLEEISGILEGEGAALYWGAVSDAARDFHDGHATLARRAAHYRAVLAEAEREAGR